MSKRNRKRSGLKRLRRKAVEVDFKGGRLTSDGGLLLLREVDRRLNLVGRIDQAILDPREPIYTTDPQNLGPSALGRRQGGVYGHCNQVRNFRWIIDAHGALECSVGPTNDRDNLVFTDIQSYARSRAALGEHDVLERFQ